MSHVRLETHRLRGRVGRRTFLRTAACVSVAPLLLPTRAHGANDRIAMGVIGSGSRGVQDMRGFLDEPDLEVVAVCDVQEDRRTNTAQLVNEHYGRGSDAAGCTAYRDFREILERDDIDVVLIAPQDHWHAAIAVMAAERGKDMYCEKPLGVSVRQCQAIREAVRRNAIVFQTGTQQRSSGNFRFACELALNGYLGDVHTVEVAAPGPSYKRKYAGSMEPQPVPPGLDYEMYAGPAPMKPFNEGRLAWPDWYLIYDYCTGFIVNWGVHHLDIALWGCPRLAMEPFDLSCTADYRNDGLCDNVNGWQAEFVYADGLRMSFTDTDHPHPQGCRFVGTEGWVHVNRQGITAEPASLLKQVIRPGEIHLHESDHHQHDLVVSVKNRRDPVAPVEAGCRASYFGMIADIAARVRRPVRWDPVVERFENDDEANRLLARPMRAPWTV